MRKLTVVFPIVGTGFVDSQTSRSEILKVNSITLGFRRGLVSSNSKTT